MSHHPRARVSLAPKAFAALRASPVLALGALLLVALPARAQQAPAETHLDVHEFGVAERESGSVSYYQIEEEPSEPFIRAMYRWPLFSVSLQQELPSELQKAARRLRWKWRAMALPKATDDCSDNSPTAASVTVEWGGRFRRWQIRYVWSSGGKPGASCNVTRNLFKNVAAVVLRSGGPIGVWVTEEIDLDAAFRAQFRGGDATAEVPELRSIYVTSDGADSHTAAGADYKGFLLLQ